MGWPNFSFLECVPGALFVLDQEGSFIFVNQKFQQVIQSSFKEVVGKNCSEVIAEGFDHLMLPLSKGVADDNNETTVSLTYLAADTVQHAFSTSFKHLHGEDGLSYIVGTFDDNNETLLSSFVKKENYKTIVESAEDIIYSVDFNGNFLYVNKKTELITGFNIQEFLKMNYLDLVPDEHKKRIYSNFHQHFLAKNNTLKELIPVVCKNGREIYLDQILTTIWDQNGSKIVGYTSVARDVTIEIYQKEFEKEKEEQYKVLFQDAQIAMRIEDFSEVKKVLDELKEGGVVDFNAYFKSHKDLVAELVKSVKVIQYNKKAREIHLPNQKSKEHSDGITSFFTQKTLDSFAQELCSIAAGHPIFETDTELLSGTEDLRHVQLKWSVLPGYEQNLERVLVTTIDVTEQQKAKMILQESQSFYQALFNESPVPLWLEDLSAVKIELDALKIGGVQDFRSYFKDRPSEVPRILSLLKVVQVNAQVLALYEASTKEELLAGFQGTFIHESLLVFGEMLVQVANNLPADVEAPVKTLLGNIIHISIRWHPLKGHEDTLERVFLSTIDVTKAHDDNLLIKENEETLSSIFENLSIPIVLSSPKDALIYDFNNAALSALGYSQDELKKLHVYDIDAQHSKEYVLKALNRCYTEGLVEGETVWKSKEGQLTEISVRNSLLKIRDEEYILSACVDITEIKKLLVENQRFRISMDNAPFGIYIFDPSSSRLYDVNQTACDMLGYSRQELMKKKVNEIEMTEIIQDPVQEAAHYQSMIATGETVHADGIHQRSDGTTFPVKVTVNARRIGGVPYVIASAFDNTIGQQNVKALEKRNMELDVIRKNLATVNTELQKEVELRIAAQLNLIKTEELERKRIAQELHDGLGQKLTAVKYGLAAVGAKNKISGEGTAILKESILMIEESMREVREMSHNLLPVVLSDFGLAAALSKICSRVNVQDGQHIRFEKQGNLPKLEDQIAVVFYRVAQEALNNAVKHSKATNIQVKLEGNSSFVELCVEDDGVGFDLEKNKSVGMGIGNIKERSTVIGADCQIFSKLSHGSSIKVKYPLSK